jgi:hypothetical protein
MVINPDLYWLAWLGMSFIGLGFVLGLVFFYLLADKAPLGRNYSGWAEIYDAAFADRKSKTRLTWIAALSSLAVGVLLIVVILPLVN